MPKYCVGIEEAHAAGHGLEIKLLQFQSLRPVRYTEGPPGWLIVTAHESLRVPGCLLAAFMQTTDSLF